MLNFSKLGYTPLIILDDGHGPETAGKRTPPFPDGTQIRENTFNKAVINLIEKDAQRLGFKTYQVAPEDTDVSLGTRTSRANQAWRDYVAQLEKQGVKLADPKKAAIFYSQHYNAHMDTWDASAAEGVETFHYTGSVEGKKLATAIHKYVIQGTKQKDRGVKEANFAVLKNTSMYAALGEAGFMDDPREAALMIDPAFQKETATQVMRGICEYFGLTYEPANDDNQVKGTPLMGPATATVAQAQEWVRNVFVLNKWTSAAAQAILKQLQDLAVLYWQIWGAIGLNPVIGFVQMTHETGYLYMVKSAAGLDASYCNPCGLKTTKGGGDVASAHQKFKNWTEGITAHADHAALYAGAPGYPKANTPDPRHFPEIRGTAPTLEALGGKWAPSLSYGTGLAVKVKQLEATKAAAQEPTTPTDDVAALKKRIADLEAQLATARDAKLVAEREAETANKRADKYVSFFKQLDTLMKGVYEQ